MLLKYGIKRHPPKIFKGNNGRRSLVERYRARHKPPEKKPMIKIRSKPRPIKVSGDPKKVRPLTLEELHGGLGRRVAREATERRRKRMAEMEAQLKNENDLNNDV